MEKATVSRPVGVLWMGHADYMDANAQAIIGQIAQTLGKLPRFRVAHSKVACTDAQAVAAAREILAGEYCGAVIVLTSWVECNVVMSAMKELRGKPMLLWGFPLETVDGKRESTGSYVSAAMLNGPVQRLNLKTEVLLGSWCEQRTLDRLQAFAAAAVAADTLFYSKIGLFGYTSMSIYPGTFDHVLLRWLVGPEVEQMDTYSLIRAAESVSPEDVAQATRKLKQITPLADDVQAQKLSKTMAFYVALKQLCREHGWSAVNVKCQYELSKAYQVVPCVALSMLADEGIVASCEGDMLCTVTMQLLGAVCGESVTYGDALSREGNVIKFSPCGFLPFSMAAPGVRVQKFLDHPGFSGIQVTGVLQPRRVTWARLVEDVGSYHLLYGTGQGLPTQPRGGCMPALDVQLDGDANALTRAYAGQHYALAYGDWSDALELWAKLTGIPTVRI